MVEYAFEFRFLKRLGDVVRGPERAQSPLELPAAVPGQRDEAGGRIEAPQLRDNAMAVESGRYTSTSSTSIPSRRMLSSACWLLSAVCTSCHIADTIFVNISLYRASSSTMSTFILDGIHASGVSRVGSLLRECIGIIGNDLMAKDVEGD